MPSRIKNALFMAIIGSVLLFVIVIFLELTFGAWFSDNPWKAAERLNILRNRRITYDVKHLGFRQDFALYTRDKNGLRGNCKNAADAQIVMVGGSTTDQRYIGDGQTWQDALEGKIKAAVNSNAFCIMNAGIDGHSTFGHIKSFETWFPLIKGLKPRYYLLYIGINDAGFRFKESDSYDNDLNPAPANTLKSKIRNNSAIYRLAILIKGLLYARNQAYAGHELRPKNKDAYTATNPTAQIEPLIDKNAKLFESRLSAIIGHIKGQGAKPICVSQPNVTAWDFGDGLKGIPKAFTYEGRDYNGLDYNLSLAALNAAMKKLCPSSGGYYIDLASRKFELNDFYDYVHATPTGSAKLGSYLFEEFKTQGIIETLK